MNIKDIGEFGFINRFSNKSDNFIRKNEIGIGDDCAIIPINESEQYVITTDLLNEDIHFIKNKISPEELGYKSLAVSLSDIAAMGAVPQYSFLSISIPENISIEFLDSFMKGYFLLSEQYKIPLLGGDTSSSTDKIVINVVVIGKCKKNKTHLRSMAQEGDLICVTGTLGDSAGGLKILLNNLKLDNYYHDLVKKHHNPIPRVAEGIFLAENNFINAMMDISDGLASDLMHILNASNKSAIINIDLLPISKTLQYVANEQNWDIDELASSGGEDHELLFTAKANDIKNIQEKYSENFVSQISIIGKIKKGPSNIIWLNKGQKIPNSLNGFSHF